MRPAHMIAMLTAFGMNGAGTNSADVSRDVSGRQKCKNPGCRTWTMSSEFCCLRCAVEAKRKRQEGTIK